MTDIRPIKIPPRGTGAKSHTERTLAYLRGRGWQCWIVERPIPGRMMKVDCFHIIDIIAITPGELWGIQSTGQDYAGHYRTLTQKRAVESARWLRAGGKLALIAWRKLKDGSYHPRIKCIWLSDLVPALRAQNRYGVLSEPSGTLLQETEK